MLTVYPDRLRRDIAVAVANASAGGKRAAGYATLSTPFTSGSIFRIYRSDVIAFQCTTTAGAAVTNGKLRLSKVYGAATVLTNADLDTGTWRWALTNGNYLTGGSIGRSALPFILTDDLATTKGFSLGDLYLTLPAELDTAIATNTDYPTISIDNLVNDQKLYSQIQPRHGTHINAHPVIRSPNYDALAAYCPAGGAQGFVDNFNEILPWLWIYNGPAHNPNLGYRIHYRRCFISLLSKTTNTWWDAPVSNSLSGYGWNGNSNSNTNSIYSRAEGDGTRSSDFNANWGAELWPTAVVDRSRVVDAKAVAVIAECRVIKNDGTPYYGADAEYVAQMGFDQYARGRGGPFKQSNGYPGFQMDGGNSRWRKITGGDWQSVAMITMQSAQTNQNPFAGYSSPWAYDQAPWCLSEAQVRGNPPVWAI